MSAEKEVRRAAREVSGFQGGTAPTRYDHLDCDHRPGVAEGMTGEDRPYSSVGGHGGYMGRDFGPEDNVSCDEDDDHGSMFAIRMR